MAAAFACAAFDKVFGLVFVGVSFGGVAPASDAPEVEEGAAHVALEAPHGREAAGLVVERRLHAL